MLTMVPDTLQWAMKRMRELQEKGEPFWVLTDLFFHLESKWRDMTRPTTFPSGLLVMAECQKLRIPCVIVTAGHHHGTAYEPANQALRIMEWPNMVDFTGGKSYEEEAETKNWVEGIRKLEEMTKTRAD